MKYKIAFLLVLGSTLTSICSATSFGKRQAASVRSVEGKPAICLPSTLKQSFSVGWITVSESNAPRSGLWGVELKAGSRPLALKPGECIAFGVVPEGYEIERYELKLPEFKLEVNKVYNFYLNDFYRPRDSYEATFCIGEPVSGKADHELIDLEGGRASVFACDPGR